MKWNYNQDVPEDQCIIIQTVDGEYHTATYDGNEDMVIFKFQNDISTEFGLTVLAVKLDKVKRWSHIAE